METAFAVQRVEVLFNGKVVETVPLSEGGRLARLAKRIDVRESGWLTLRALTDNPVYPIDDSHLYAETGPVYVYCGGRPIRSKADANYFIKWIDDITVMARDDPGWRSDREREHVLTQFAEARKGSLTEGKLADFVVLSRDLFSVPPHEVLETRPVVTVVGGRIVYEAASGATSPGGHR